MRGLYLHIPFCSKKCVYCDFYSLETTQHIGAFVDTLLLEIALRAQTLASEQKHFSTVFFGGGTPSLLSAKQMELITTALHDTFTFADGAEWTMECNPGTVTAESLAGYRAVGINRLSFGVQSFFEQELEFLSRIHSRSEAVEAVHAARKAGFDNVNVDLMFALPGQSFERWRQNLELAAELETEHISAYSLIFEEGTPLNAMRLRGEVAPQNEEADVEMYEWTMNFLAARGYEQYEVSNFARKGLHCRHNCLYWQGEEYVAFGPSAHGYIVSTDITDNSDNSNYSNTPQNRIHTRYWNARSLKRYTDDVRSGVLPVVNSEELSSRERMFERAFLELRSQGIRTQAFERDFGFSVEKALQAVFKKYDGEHLWYVEPRANDTLLHLTPRGYTLCDAISADVIAALEHYVGEQWQPSPEMSEY